MRASFPVVGEACSTWISWNLRRSFEYAANSHQTSLDVIRVRLNCVRNSREPLKILLKHRNHG